MKKSLITILIFTIIGTLFSGYLTFTKLISGLCPLTEGCYYLFGYPTCLFGFIFFLALLISSLIAIKKQKAISWIFWISLVAILFSGYFSYKEIFYPLCIGRCVYSLLIPSCIYGLFMYIIIFIFSIIASKKPNGAKI